jgi:glycosyltransferase involved in cell wall biosynthesis
MRVAIIHHQFKLKGGMETYLFNLLTGFNQKRDKVSVYVYKQHKIKSDSCVVERVNLFWLPRFLRKYWFGSRLYKREGMREYDLTISLMRSFYQDVIVCGGTHRGFLAHMQKNPTLLDKLEIVWEQKSYDTASLIIAHSMLLRQELIELYGISPEKIMTSYPPIDIDKFNRKFYFQRQALKKKFNLDSHKRAVLFPSTGHKRKGFFLILEAFKSLPHHRYELVIAGSPPPANVDKNITYLGFVEDMAALYSACDVTLLPSYYEPFGLAVIESLQCGTPVIVSEFVGAKNLISENEGIILKELSSAAIVKAIEQSTLVRFNIPLDFAQRKGLTVDAHIQKLKNSVQHIKKGAS